MSALSLSRYVFQLPPSLETVYTRWYGPASTLPEAADNCGYVELFKRSIKFPFYLHTGLSDTQFVCGRTDGWELWYLVGKPWFLQWEEHAYGAYVRKHPLPYPQYVRLPLLAVDYELDYMFFGEFEVVR